MMASLRVTTFANTFLIPGNNGRGRPVLKVVGPEETRKKRPHRKSRLGCIRCKRRKVKCDEGDPCRNCVKRNETCVRRSPASSNRGGESSPSLTSPPPEVAWCPLSEPECGPINLLHMELLHHFERHTMHTLSFQEVWPRLLQLAFQSRQHTYLVNAMLAMAAAHLDYLIPENPRYHRAKYALLDKALHDYRGALSAPITADNCDALLGTANLVHFLMWCDLSFMDGQTPGNSHQPLDLSGDRLYWLSTGVRQIFFMAWPLFQTTKTAFRNISLLQPCMVLEDVVDTLGLNWQRFSRAFMELYDNPRYRGGRNNPNPSPNSEPPLSYTGSIRSSSSSSSESPSPASLSPSSLGSHNTPLNSSTAFFADILPTHPSSSTPPFKIMTLYESFKEGEAYVKSAGACDERLMRAAFKRIVDRLAVAVAFTLDRDGERQGKGDGGCPVRGMTKSQGGRVSNSIPPLKPSDVVRYVSVFPMMCFGPLLALISGGDSRVLVVLFHIYRVVEALLPEETYWWCKRRGKVMVEAIGRELRIRGLEVCLRRQNEVV